MIVIDASAMVEALVGRDPDPALLDALTREVSAPHLLDVEVLSALRGLTLAGKLDLDDADQARRDYFAFTISRYDTEPLADRVWALRHRFTSYDACYPALAEAVDAKLWTGDGKLENGHAARVHVVNSSPPPTSGG